MSANFDSSTVSCRISTVKGIPIVDYYLPEGEGEAWMYQVARTKAKERAAVHWRGKRLVYKEEVLYAIGCSSTTLWRWIKADKFPKGFLVGGRRAWRESDLTAWLNHQEMIAALEDGTYCPADFSG
jgi:predicted DNA-binding transcriptional regulator AlpA